MLLTYSINFFEPFLYLKYYLKKLEIEIHFNFALLIIQVRIDHRTGAVHFGTDLSEAQRTEISEGPTIQTMPSEQVEL